MSSNRLVLATLLGLLTMHPTPAANADDDVSTTADSGDAGTATDGATRVLTDFGPSTPDLGWYVVSDGVMGGRSQGDFVRNGEGIDFSGVTNTDGGGFSSIRTRGLRLDLGDFDGIRVRVFGDGRRYTWRLTTDALWRGRQVGYWADFETVAGEWTVADIPFTRFEPQWRGRKLSDLVLDPRRIRGMGLMIYDKADGAFAIRLHSVQAYEKQAPFALRDHQRSKRLLVASAATADEPHLKALLAAVAATREEFEQRDMLLVVVLDTPGSRVGERLLDEGDVRAVRHDAGIEGDAFALRLVGKDGGVKRSASAFTTMKGIYELIDTMPMRRAESGRSEVPSPESRGDREAR